ncbi:type II toxin-antitoxin system RelE/ParE family toxin [Anabaena azotica]|uniref:Killer suppression protein HigA n=1 Tax=Anabaena azotica FACHB-119 TaxID=947527 RepID=A0ABR8D4K2_9NOST|nr:killer suppression protein HigA [Anabaena azotica]MBD2501386.1 killer suppression protein HigA [Anabaena azotica FACHB-119]
MEITFAGSKLQKLCEEKNLAQKELGANCAKKLKARLADLAAVSCVAELTAGCPHQLKGDRAGQYALDIDQSKAGRGRGGKRLVFEPDHDPVPLRQDGSIDWSKVTAVCIVFIGDYHD